ncbi:hypothetical protein [Gordonia jinhuaensis]|nr:hypothetical protein [Gordonia jinhuaensis]
MSVTNWRRKDLPLSEFPGWGLEMMMGLYGEQQIVQALESEAKGRRGRKRAARLAAQVAASRSTPTPHEGTQYEDAQHESGASGDIAAVNSMLESIGRLVHRHRRD